MLGSQVIDLVLCSLLAWLGCWLWAQPCPVHRLWGGGRAASPTTAALPSSLQGPGLCVGARFPSGPGLFLPGGACFGSAGAGRASSCWRRRARGTSPAPAQPVTALLHAATSFWGCLEKRCASTLTFLEQGHHTL